MLTAYLSIDDYPVRVGVFMHSEKGRVWLAE